MGLLSFGWHAAESLRETWEKGVNAPHPRARLSSPGQEAVGPEVVCQRFHAL